MSSSGGATEDSGKADQTKRKAKMAAFLVLIVSLFWIGAMSPAIAYSRAGEPQKRPRPRQQVRRAPPPPRINYGQFSHVTHVNSQKLACDSCHKFPTKNWKDVRKGDAAFPDVAEFPEHSACLECHRTQFFARERPAPAICSNCHVKVTPKDTARFLFPSLSDITDSTLVVRESVSEFRVGFPHDKHLDVVGMNQPGFLKDKARFVNAFWNRQKPPDQSKTCSICHQIYQPQGSSSEEYATKPPKNLGDNFWLKKGTFQTAPNSHTGCFVCHNADSGIAPESKDCQACHKLTPPAQKVKADFDPKLAADMGIVDKTILEKWGRRTSAGGFRHEGGEHPNLGCVSCHNVTVMNTVEPTTLKVPIRSCGGAEGCHITAIADDGGILNFEIDQKKANAGFACTKCHITFGKEAVPMDHPKAIPTPAKR